MKRILSLALCLILCLTLLPTAPAVAASGVKINETNFPDDIFREFVTAYYDDNQNGYLSETELLSVKHFDLTTDFKD